MKKITEPDYSLLTIEALLGFQSFQSGANQPMVIQGVCQQTGEKGEYVVKFKGAPRMSIEASCRELIASFIALELDLFVPEPVLINVSQDFINTLMGNLGYKAASNSLGYNFGCKYFPGYFEFTRNQTLSDVQTQQAENIFGFDVFIFNPDRRPEKPNMLTNGENILIFDHELAFEFVLSIIKNPEPWILGPEERVLIQNHFFYTRFKDNPPDLAVFFRKLTTLDQNFWDQVNVLLPEEWKTNQVDQIISTLKEIIIRQDVFHQEIKKVLS